MTRPSAIDTTWTGTGVGATARSSSLRPSVELPGRLRSAARHARSTPWLGPLRAAISVIALVSSLASPARADGDSATSAPTAAPSSNDETAAPSPSSSPEPDDDAAQPTPTPSPGPALRTAAEPLRFAVVVGNNVSLDGGRPDLHYADDDAARYFDMLQPLAPGRVTLLAKLDRDTERLFPDARRHAVTPRRAQLLNAGKRLAEQVRAAKQRGLQTEVYFVFAGHGDVDRGTGYVELADGRFDANDLERWLRSIPFTRAHVILDSCNSFFMLGVRKPGGRHFATAADSARSLAARLPNVGVFLSTSSEGETFEWSEIQSGIFSHVVRSGLLGAADADGDGSVSYVELAGFVDTATGDVKNPNMRPHVYFRGPGARDDAPILSRMPEAGVRRFSLRDALGLRVRLRDAEGLVLLDAHSEPGTPLHLALPEQWVGGAVVERTAKGERTAKMYTLPDSTEPVRLDALQPIAMRGAARGPAEVFEKLFARPYGPLALANYRSERSTRPAQVFGVSRDDARRMELVLSEIAGAERNQRLMGGVVLLGAGALVGGAGLSAFQFADDWDGVSRKEAHEAGATFSAIGAAYMLGGGYMLLSTSSGEEAAEEFRLTLRDTGDYTKAFAVADARLQEMIETEQRLRWIRGIVGGGLLAAGLGSIVVSEFSDNTPEQRVINRIVGGAVGLMGATALGASLLVDSPAERLMRVWRDDSSLIQVQPTAAVSSEGAFVLGLSGTF